MLHLRARTFAPRTIRQGGPTSMLFHTQYQEGEVAGAADIAALREEIALLRSELHRDRPRG